MSLTKAEKWVLAITAAFVLLTVGFRMGRQSTPAEFSVRTSAESRALPAAETENSQSAEHGDIAEKININTADEDTLCTLNGIGEVLARRVIEYRETNGPFSAVEDIMNVSGIGSATLAKISEKICVE